MRIGVLHNFLGALELCAGAMYSNRRNYAGYGSSGHSSSRSLSLPSGMSPGAIIGKGGSNIKLLQSRSGARVSVNNSSGCVEVSGTPAAVEEALRLLQLQIDAFQATGGSYPHPLQVHYLLDTSFGSSTSATLAFQPRSDEVTRATDRSEQMYVLSPADTLASHNAPAGSWAAHDDLTDMMSGLSMGSSGRVSASSGKGPLVHLSSQQQQVLQHAVSAAHKAAQHRPRFDEMKLRFNFGKNFFYKGPTAGTRWTIQQLQGKSIPDNLKSVYSNAVTSAAQRKLEAWLQQQGFYHVESKHTASVHLQHRETNAGYTLSLIKTSGHLTLRKLKSSNNKLAFVTLLSDPELPDWRFKALAQYHFKADPVTQQQLRDLASSATLSPGSGRVSMRGLASSDMVVDKERHKDKTIYTGSYRAPDDYDNYTSSSSGYSHGTAGTTIKVTLSQVFDGVTGRRSCEVAGTSPELTEVLQQCLETGDMSSSMQQQVMQHMADLMAFARAAVQVMGN